MTPGQILENAIKAVPAVRYALGVAGVAAVVAIVSGFLTDPRVAVFGTIIMFGLMTVLVVFSQLTRTTKPELRILSMTLAWAFVVLIIATSFFIFTGFFFSWPRPLAGYLPQPSPTPIPSPTPSPTPTLRFIAPRNNQKVLVQLNEAGRGWVEVKGTLENVPVPSRSNLRVYIFTQSAEKSAGGWWYINHSDPNEKGEWTVPRVQLGGETDEVIEEKRFRIEAIVAPRERTEQIVKISNKPITSLVIFHPLDRASVNIIVGHVVK